MKLLPSSAHLAVLYYSCRLKSALMKVCCVNSPQDPVDLVDAFGGKKSEARKEAEGVQRDQQ